jgi:hypothetical protein
MSQVTNNPPYLRVDEIFFGLDVTRTEKMWVEDFKRPHCKPSPFGKQFCLANTAIFSSYITFQNIQKKIFYPKQM